MQILLFTPDKLSFEMSKKIISNPDIKIEFQTVDDAVDAAKSYIPKGLEIIIARGGTAKLIRDKLPYISVVEMHYTNIDIINAINEAKKFGDKIAVIIYPINIIKPLIPLFQCEIKLYEVEHPNKIEQAVLDSISSGADVIVGGGVQFEIAKQYGMSSVMIGVSKNTIVDAINEALELKRTLHYKKIRLGELTTILENIDEGIIAIDNKNIITCFNSIAGKLTNRKQNNTLGKSLIEVLPEFDGIYNDKDKSKYILIGNNDIFYNKVPIIVDDEPLGSIITLQEANNIQKREAEVRKQLYSKGHIARYSFNDILGISPSIRQNINIAKKYSKADSSILILGETGTGKELFAQSIHNTSKRANSPFVAINCAALPQNIIESELFGYEEGAFTGAKKKGKPGLFEIGHMGTVFLDEVSSLNLETQGRLLRVLQEKTLMRLGSDRVIHVDVRIISATNDDLHTMIEQGNFRSDLYYRLNILNISLPPLRKRPDDIEVYINHFLSIFNRRDNKIQKMNRNTLSFLRQYHWPGNIRELINVMERISIIHPSGTIDLDVLKQIMLDNHHSLFSNMNEEYNNITTSLQKANGNITTAAKILGIHRVTLWRKMKKYDINVYHEQKSVDQ